MELRKNMHDDKKIGGFFKINIAPKGVQVKTVAQGSTLRAALTHHGVKQDMLEELAVLNGMELNDSVSRGMLIKVVE